MTTEPTTAPSDRPTVRHELVWLLAVSAAVIVGYSFFATRSALWDEDEGRFARATVEMLDGGDYLVPHLNTDLRLHKPSGVYWAMAAAVAAIGKTELAFRLPSILGMTLCGVMTYLIGRRMFGVAVARWAYVVLATSLLPLVMGTLATADGLLNGFLAVALWLIVEASYGKFRAVHAPLLAVAIGGALLLKGPPGIFPLMSLGGILLWGRGQVRLSRGTWALLVAGTLVGVAIFLAWAIPANNATGGQFLSEGVGKHVVQRGTEAMEGHGGSSFLGYLAMLPIYVPLLLLGIFPWVMHLPGALRATLNKRLGGVHERAILWGGTVPIFVVFTFYATKLPHYILPIFPVVAVMIAATIVAHDRCDTTVGALSEGDRHSLRGGGWWFGPIALGSVVGLLLLPIAYHGPMGLLTVGPLAAVMLLGAALAIWMQAQEAISRASMVLVKFAIVSVIGVSIGLMPTVIEALRPAPRLAKLVNEHRGGGPVYWLGYHKPTFLLYLDLPADEAVTSLDAQTQLVDFIRGDRGAAVVTDEHRARYEAIFFEQTGESLVDHAALFSVEVFDRGAEGRRSTLWVIAPGGAAGQAER